MKYCKYIKLFGYSPYAMSNCVSKATVDQFTKCASLELAAKGIRVNSTNPAAI